MRLLRYVRGLVHDPLPAITLLSLPIALYGVALLFDSSVNWSNPEYIIFSIPGALVNGIELQWNDLLRGFNPWLFDVVRPRFINYVITIINVKLRLLSYHYFIPSANLSIGLIVHLLLAPALFYVLCRKFFDSKWAALLGTCLYVSSVGFLSSVVLFVQPGKNLLQVMTLALFVGLAMLHEKDRALPFGEERRRIVGAIMFLNLVGISIDELWLVSAPVGAVLFYRLFVPPTFGRDDILRSVRACTLYFSPFVAFLLFAVFVAPWIGSLLGNGWCDYLGFFIGQAAEKGDKIPLLPFLYDLTATALAASWLPHPFPPGMSPYALSLRGWPVLALAACLLAIVALLARNVATRRGASLRNLGVPERVALATIAYFILQGWIQRMGEQITGGYYYCSLTAVMVSLLIVSLFAARGAGRYRIIIAVLVPIVMIVQIGNFLDLNGRWRAGHAPSTRAMLDQRHAYPNLVVTEDGPRSAEQTARMTDLWRRWKRGERLDAGLMQNWPIADGWFLVELDALDGRIFKDPKPSCNWERKPGLLGL